MARGGPQRIPRPPGSRRGAPPRWSALTPAERSAIGLGTVRAALDARGSGAPPEFVVPGARAAAVLVPLFEEDGELRVLLTRRASTLNAHRGEVAFPGGRQDQGEDLSTAALREAEEEIALGRRQVELIGELDRLSTVASRFVISPFVGALDGRPETVANPSEIERVFDVGVPELLEEGVYREELWDMPWGEREISFFELEGDTVWGATARILRQLLELITA